MAESGSTGRRAAAPPCTLVIFGATGDLTKRLVMPAIYNLVRGGLLSRNFAIIGRGRGEQTDREFSDYLGKEVRGFMSGREMGGVPIPFDEEAWGFLADRISFIGGDPHPARVYRHVGAYLLKVGAWDRTAGNVVFSFGVAA